MDQKQLIVLPNPVDLEGICAASTAPSARIGPGPHLLAVGRLVREKGFDLLIEAFAAVRERFPGADLIIAGSRTGRSGVKIPLPLPLFGECGQFRRACRSCPSHFFPEPRCLCSLRDMKECRMPCSRLRSGPTAGRYTRIGRSCRSALRAARRVARNGVSAKSLAETMMTALSSIHPGERFHHQFFPSAAD